MTFCCPEEPVTPESAEQRMRTRVYREERGLGVLPRWVVACDLGEWRYQDVFDSKPDAKTVRAVKRRARAQLMKRIAQ